MKKLILIITLLCTAITSNGQLQMMLHEGAEIVTDTLLLDSFPADAAYSIRKLRTGADSCMIIRRSSDNSELLIGFSGVDLDTVSINTHCSGTNCYVKTWVDQTGNGNNISQTTTTKQPLIYTSSAIIREGQSPTVKFDGVDDVLQRGSFSLDNTWTTAFQVLKTPPAGSGREYWLSSGSSHFSGDFTGSGRYFSGYGSGGGQFIDFTDASLQDNHTIITTTIVSSGSSTIHFNGSLKASGGTSGTFGSGLNIGARSIADFFSENLQEVIIYFSDKTSDQSTIEQNINNKYSIF